MLMEVDVVRGRKLGGRGRFWRSSRRRRSLDRRLFSDLVTLSSRSVTASSSLYLSPGGTDPAQRFGVLAKYLPFLPVFGGGVVRFQYVHLLSKLSE